MPPVGAKVSAFNVMSERVTASFQGVAVVPLSTQRVQYSSVSRSAVSALPFAAAG